MKNIILILVLSLLHILPAYSQDKQDHDKFRNLFAVDKHRHNWKDQLKNNHNEPGFILSATFFVYKEFLSSQDIDACVFTPSCSVYAIEVIKKKGLIPGFLNAMDRITRCNPIRNKHLPVDQQTGKFYDPPE